MELKLQKQQWQWRLVSEQRRARKESFGFDHARNEARDKKGKRWEGRGRKDTLADKALDFENLRSPVNAVPDWLG